MLKTRKSIAKRIKITGSGKMMRRTPGHRHMMRNKGTKQLRKATQDQAVSEGFTRQYRRALFL
ncbi:MAG: 50S ribosomal protein L35 [Verrucomicrobia bacterium ADurb.Bin474]|nr:50S ribosomal protein L35 [Opitutales bacterium]MDD4348203.1 50S ribosomal protein L35 [Opitutales bacterium]OPZ73726.1 MAG: 50S ribosomal protein L35 [Verrucomicrobia bacterium ADurb.Bin474]